MAGWEPSNWDVRGIAMIVSTFENRVMGISGWGGQGQNWRTERPRSWKAVVLEGSSIGTLGSARTVTERGVLERTKARQVLNLPARNSWDSELGRCFQKRGLWVEVDHWHEVQADAFKERGGEWLGSSTEVKDSCSTQQVWEEDITTWQAAGEVGPSEDGPFRAKDSTNSIERYIVKSSETLTIWKMSS